MSSSGGIDRETANCCKAAAARLAGDKQNPACAQVSEARLAFGELSNEAGDFAVEIDGRGHEERDLWTELDVGRAAALGRHASAKSPAIKSDEKTTYKTASGRLDAKVMASPLWAA